MGKRNKTQNGGGAAQLSLFAIEEQKAPSTQTPVVQAPEQIPLDHHHMELHYDDGHREIICSANPYTVQYDAHSSSAGYVGDVIPEGQYCSICSEAKPIELPPKLDRFSFTRASLKRQSPESEARRAWLLQWAEKRGWGSYSWTTHGRYDGFYQVSMEAGEERWRHFIESGDRFQVYCCFIEARAPQSLKYYLKCAVETGEISASSLDGSLIIVKG